MQVTRKQNYFSIRLILIFLASGLLLSCFTAGAQKSTSEVSKNTQKKYLKAEALFTKKSFSEAVAVLDKIIKKNPEYIDAQILKGRIHFIKQEFSIAKIHLLKAFELDSTYNMEVILALSDSYAIEESYDEATSFLRRYLNEEEFEDESKRERLLTQLELYRFRDSLLNQKYPLEFEKLPSEINGEGSSEYLPSLTADGRNMYFTRAEGGQEDLFFVSKSDSGEWTKAKYLEGINTFENEGAHCISADGNTILVTLCSDGRNNIARGCNIYISQKTNGKWSVLKYMEEINSKSWDSQPTISWDGNKIIFASRRNGGFGKSDLWTSSKNKTGIWSEPKNLGQQINTPGDETTPFLHGDDQSLFFRSDGHMGLGNNDLFLAKWIESGRWTHPENLGFPINSKDEEGGIVVALNGKDAYTVKGSKTKGFDRKSLDIYSFELPEGKRVEDLGFIRFWVKDAETLESLKCTMEVQEYRNDEMVTKQIKSLEDGSILYIFRKQGNYSITINKEGYQFFSDRVQRNIEDTGILEEEREIFLIPAEEKDSISNPIVLQNILFETGKADLVQESFFELDKLFEYLQINTSIKIRILGHTDNIGSEEDNQKLSEDRAEAVTDYLVDKGVNKDRIQYEGYGESKPIADNSSESGRKLNRRTEFIIIY